MLNSYILFLLRPVHVPTDTEDLYLVCVFLYVRIPIAITPYRRFLFKMIGIIRSPRTTLMKGRTPVSKRHS